METIINLFSTLTLVGIITSWVLAGRRQEDYPYSSDKEFL